MYAKVLLHLGQLSLLFSIIIASNASSFICVAARNSTPQLLHFTTSCVICFYSSLGGQRCLIQVHVYSLFFIVATMSGRTKDNRHLNLQAIASGPQ